MKVRGEEEKAAGPGTDEISKRAVINRRTSEARSEVLAASGLPWHRSALSTLTILEEALSTNHSPRFGAIDPVQPASVSASKHSLHHTLESADRTLEVAVIVLVAVAVVVDTAADTAHAARHIDLLLRAHDPCTDVSPPTELSIPLATLKKTPHTIPRPPPMFEINGRSRSQIAGLRPPVPAALRLVFPCVPACFCRTSTDYSASTQHINTLRSGARGSPLTGHETSSLSYRTIIFPLAD
ncbi:hypothetical protein EIP86_005158 [Pleurotus ostreatoroseus]|nr:hypothetical protein EIP86_005158 [Pleurotus ostreatoroseus]